MFAHAEEAGQKEHEQTIHWGNQQLVCRAGAEAKTLAIQIVGFRTTREEIQGIYNEVYQQKRLLGPHHMSQSRWRPLIRKSALPWKSRHGRGGVPPGWRWIWGEPLQYFVAQPPDQIPLQDPGKE